MKKFVQDLWNNPFFWISFAVVIVIRLLLKQRRPIGEVLGRTLPISRTSRDLGVLLTVPI